MMYGDDDMLMLSGIQHYRFCPRQWAFIHIEQLWDDNRLTMEGILMHKHVDDPFYRQKCGENIALRAVNVASHELGLYGVTDIVELHPSDDAANSIKHPRYPGLWQPYQACGSLILWSISMANQREMKSMRFNWQRKPCVLKNSTAYEYHTVLSSTARYVIGWRWR